MSSYIWCMNWYAIYTKPKSELKAKAFFEQQGFDSFVPFKKTVEKKAKKLVCKQKVLISGLAFFKMEELNFEMVNQNPFTKSIVRSLGKPALISEQEINAMKNYLCPKSTHSDAYQHGELIAIESGIFAGSKAEVVEHRGDFVWVTLKSIGLKMCINLASNKVEVA